VRRLFIAVGLLTAGPSVARAQVYAAAPVLQIMISARGSSMGVTGVADNSDPANIYFNPANVVGAARVYAQGSRWDFIPVLAPDIWIGGGSAGICQQRADSRLATLSADVSYGRLDYGESTVTDPSGFPLGTFKAYEDYLALTLGAALRVADTWDLRVGIAGKRVHLNYGPEAFTTSGEDNDIDGFAFDAGITLARRAVVSDWNVVAAFALAVLNNGPDLEFPSGNSDPLPGRFHFGSSIRVDSPTVRVLSAEVPMVAFVYNLEGVERFHGDDFSWGIGGEFALAQVLFVRAGVSDHEDRVPYDRREVSGWGVGLGLPAGSFRARFDFARTSAIWEDQFGLTLDWMFQ
jgi:hypothetical protein